MRTNKLLTGAVIALAAIAPVVYGASEITVDYVSAYVWRGQVLNSAAVVQPGMTVETPVGLSLNAWGNMDATKKNEKGGKFNEIDLTANYSVPMGEDMPVALDLGVINYTFPYLKEDVEGGADETTEIYASLGFDVIAAPALTVYYDVDNVNGYYANLGIGHSFELTEMAALDLGASIGYADSAYNKAYFGDSADRAAFNDMNLSVGISYAVSEEITMGVAGTYTRLMDSDVRDAGKASYGYKDHYYGGLSMAYAF